MQCFSNFSEKIRVKFENFSEKIRSEFKEILEKRNRHEAYFFVCLLGLVPAVCSNMLISTLGLAETFGWSGFYLGTGTGENAYATWRVAALLALIVGVLLLITVPTSAANRLVNLFGLIPLFILAVGLTADVIGSVMSYHIDGKATDNWADIATAELNSRLKADQDFARRNVSYLVSCFAVLVGYLWQFGMRSRSFKYLCFLCLCISCFWVHKSWNDSPILQVIVSLYPIAMFVLGVAIIRVFFRAFQDNVDVPKRMNTHQTAFKGSFLKKIAKTTGYCIPFFLVFGGILYFNQKVETWSENLAYCNDYEKYEKDKCNPNDVKITPVAGVSFGSVIKPIIGETRMPRDDLQIHVLDILYKAKETVGKQNWPTAAEVKNGVLSRFDDVIKPDLADYSASFRVTNDCFYFKFPKLHFSPTCLMKDLKNRVLNSFYQIPRNAFRNRVEILVDAAIAKAKVASTTVDINAIRTEIVNQISGFALDVRRVLDVGWLTLAFLFFFQLALLLQGLVRAFLSVLARLLVAPNAKLDKAQYFTMFPASNYSSASNKEDIPQDLESIPQDEGKCILSLSEDEVFFVKSALDVSNASSAFSFPIQCNRLIFSRIVHGKYFLRKLIRNNDRPMCLSDISGKRFVSLRLKEGEEIAFSWKNFVGITNNIKLGRKISLTLPMAATGHILAPVAKGPGLLVLKTSGQALISRSGKAGDSVAPYRLIAWSTAGEFRVNADHRILSVYMEDCQLDISHNDKAVLDISEDGLRVFGLFRNLWKLLRP